MWSDLKIPIYGDSKDATKITAYKTITDDIFKTVSKNDTDGAGGIYGNILKFFYFSFFARKIQKVNTVPLISVIIMPIIM